MNDLRFPVPTRRFLPDDFQPDSWDRLAPRFEALVSRNLTTCEELEAWLLDRSELASLIAAEASRRYVNSACHTEDEDAERAHLEYQTEVLPEVKKANDRLDRKFLETPARNELVPEYWMVYDRDVQLQVELFRKENVPLEAEEEKLSTEYGQITGGMTVEYEGTTHTLPALARYGEDADREVRETTWRLAAERRYQDREAMETLFEKMLVLRGSMARNAGYDNFRDYQHRRSHRFDYSPQDCLELHDNIERFVLPLMRRVQVDRAERLGLSQLRPWDLGADPDGLPAFEPFQDSAQQVEIAARLYDFIDDGFANDLRWLVGQGLLDLETRKGKRPGGFMDTFEDVRLPFIFSNSGTTHSDVETVLHEGGHAMHALLSREIEPLDYRHAPLEFAEVASMSMECLSLEHLHEIYPRREARRCVLSSLEGIVRGLAWMAIVDAFQHWLYTHQDHTREERRNYWLQLRDRFAPGIDWSGLESYRAYDWQRLLHIFEVPFYYIEYAIAQIGALQVWQRYRKDSTKAIAAYRRGLALGGSKPLPELFAATGIRFDPRGESLESLMHDLGGLWDRLRQEHLASRGETAS